MVLDRNFAKALKGMQPKVHGTRHAAQGAWHQVLPTIQDSQVLIPRNAG